MAKSPKLFSKIGSKLRGVFFGTPESVVAQLASPAADFGVPVTTESAMRFSAVYAAIKILSDNIAALPKAVKKKTKDGEEDAVRHPAYQIINVQPNAYTDVFTFWWTIMCWLEGKRGAFAKIEWVDGEPVALHQIDPDYVRIEFINGRKIYVVNHPNPDFKFLNGTYDDYEMLHFFIFSLDGIRGVDPITWNAASIGRGLATVKFSSDFYRKGGQIKGALEAEGSFDDDSFNAFMTHYQNSARNFETPLLEYGVKYKPIGIDPAAAQIIQTETLSIQDIARIFSVPPHLLAEMSHSTFSNIEEQNIFFSIYSLRPICKRIEQQLESKLFLGSERGKYSVKFDLRGMMRGDDEARAAYYASAVQNGWMTPNEARTLEGLKRLPGLDRPRVSLNYNEIDAEGNIVQNKQES